MNVFQRNLIAMLQMVVRFCDDHLTTLQAIPALFAIYGLFKTKVTSLGQLVQLLDMETTGPAKDKKTLRANLCSMAAQVAGCLRAFARGAGNNDLWDRVNYSFSDLFHANDELLPERCKNIYDLATTHLGDLADFGIDAGFMAVFQQSLDAFNLVKKTPGLLRAEHKSNRELFDITLAEAKNILRYQLDDAMVIFKSKDPDFYREYENASTIVDLSGKKNVVPDPDNIACAYGAVTFSDGSYNPDVMISFINSGHTVIAETDEESEYFVESLPSGTWTITVECFGYETIRIENYTVEEGDEITLDFNMVSLG